MYVMYKRLKNLISLLFNVYLFILFINIRETNKRTILGKIYLDSIYIITVISVKLYTVSLIK